jgi:enoyl-CoA hydratase/carnithine racemase
VQPPEGIAEHRPREGVLRWELCNHARRNAVSPAVLRFIAQRCAALHGEVVVLEGAGDKAFCSGFDLTTLGRDLVPGTLPDAPLIEATAAMRTADATLVAAIGGPAIGAGVELACACDFRIAVDTATFSIPAARLGVVYHADGLVSIRAAFGPALAAALVLAGHTIGAREALAAGALVRAVPRDVFAASVDALVDDLTAGVPRSVAGNRDLLRALAGGPLTDATRARHEHARARAYESVDPGRVLAERGRAK